MANTFKLDKSYAEYLRSGCWICPGHNGIPSPTGAHHWLYVSGSIWVCKYCWDNKKFPMTFGDSFGKVEKLEYLHEEKTNV